MLTLPNNDEKCEFKWKYISPADVSPRYCFVYFQWSNFPWKLDWYSADLTFVVPSCDFSCVDVANKHDQVSSRLIILLERSMIFQNNLYFRWYGQEKMFHLLRMAREKLFQISNQVRWNVWKVEEVCPSSWQSCDNTLERSLCETFPNWRFLQPKIMSSSCLWCCTIFNGSADTWA